MSNANAMALNDNDCCFTERPQKPGEESEESAQHNVNDPSDGNNSILASTLEEGSNGELEPQIELRAE